MEIFKHLMKSLTSINDFDKMEQLFSELFTEKERMDISSRWLLMTELIKGRTQREIAGDHHLSLCKITRGAKILHNENSICRQLIEKSIKKEGKQYADKSIIK